MTERGGGGGEENDEIVEEEKEKLSAAQTGIKTQVPTPHDSNRKI